MLSELNENMTLKEIADLHPELYEILQHFGFNLNVGKMSSLKDACKKKGLNLPEVLKTLNRKVKELNQREKEIDEAIKKRKRDF
ncbi:DUF1858 domain-containing protein [Kosmotoga pacifica]|uniref:DUF1858 domain-containing protein n=1 Tax=Kosmotoga pacifica TaxID=1330330 RepID=A0A0G2ZD84_9BACT|nr:DUF1858 domain-containing protein [Kosmotoga pacifica]AKI97514.1 hypothetical protein IX53_06450 [Kosmotoga pacifica]